MRRCYRWNPVYISTHTPLARRDPGRPDPVQYPDAFLLTRLSRGVTNYLKLKENIEISTHTPLARRDLRRSGTTDGITFLLTRLSRGVTRLSANNSDEDTFLLTRLSRGVTDFYRQLCGNDTFLLTRLSRGVTCRSFLG